MKTILIGTDFSAASRNASLYGVQLAKDIGANIILFNAYEVPVLVSGLGVRISRYSVMMETHKRLLEEAGILDPAGTMIETLCDEGVAEDAILNIAKEKKADFIIIGMKGSGKILKKLLGSTANLLAKNTNIPLIIVPEEGKYTMPRIIVFASDALRLNYQLPEQIISFANSFNSKLYVVKVVSNNSQECLELVHNDLQPEKITQSLHTSFQFPVNSDIRHGLDKFIKEHDADLLVMTPHRHKLIERMYRESQTTDMIFHTKIPLLILPERIEKQQTPNKDVARYSKY